MENFWLILKYDHYYSRKYNNDNESCKTISAIRFPIDKIILLCCLMKVILTLIISSCNV